MRDNGLLQALIFLSDSRILGFSDWRRPSMATFSAGYSRRKIRVSPMWYASSIAAVIFSTICFLASGLMPGGASTNTTGITCLLSVLSKGCQIYCLYLLVQFIAPQFQSATPIFQ